MSLLLKWAIETLEGIGVVTLMIVGVILWSAPSSFEFLLKLWRTWKGNESDLRPGFGQIKNGHRWCAMLRADG